MVGIEQRRGSGNRARFPVEEIIQNRGFGKASVSERVRFPTRGASEQNTKTALGLFLYFRTQPAGNNAKHYFLAEQRAAIRRLAENAESVDGQAEPE